MYYLSFFSGSLQKHNCSFTNFQNIFNFLSEVKQSSVLTVDLETKALEDKRLQGTKFYSLATTIYTVLQRREAVIKSL